MGRKREHVLLIGLEYVDPIFSGNGVLTRGVVDGLVHHLGYDVTVLCARPARAPAAQSEKDAADGAVENGRSGEPDRSGCGGSRLRVCTVSVPDERWRRLDRHSAWRELAAGAPDALRSSLRETNDDSDNDNANGDCRTGHHRYRYVFCIDWTAVPTYENLVQAGLVSEGTEMILLVLRVFSRSRELLTSNDDVEFYRQREMDAIGMASATFVLSHVDRDELSRLLVHHDDDHRHDCNGDAKDEGEESSYSPSSTDTSKHGRCQSVEFHIMVPPLRDDVLRLARQFDGPAPAPGDQPDSSNRRKYLVCNVRLSPEKNALTFAHLVSHLHSTGIFHRLDLTPVLLGTVCDPSYASRVKSLLPPCAVCVDEFLSPEKLLDYLRRSVLLIHPPTYDAYGMIVAEAASVGTPSVIHHEMIGASSLFSVDRGEVLTVDMDGGDEGSVRESAGVLTDWLTNEMEELRLVGERARRRAVGWTVGEYARRMGEVLDEVAGGGVEEESPCDV